MNESLNISILQYDIKWEDPVCNIRKVSELLSSNYEYFKSDIVLLPEMFSTGFTMNTSLAQNIDGETIEAIKKLSKQYDIALFGSFMCIEQNKLFNRAFFITPDSETYYDKKHLFRPGDETKYYSSGDKQIIVDYKGWKIMLQICYDLRFPVWCRNINNNYDLLLIAANGPAIRQYPWDILMRARAIENSCYVAAVNRVGYDGNNIYHSGDSAIIYMKGKTIARTTEGNESVINQTISLDSLKKFRNTFPVGKDADKLIINA